MKKELCRILVLLLLVNSCSAPLIDKFRALFNRNRSLATQTNTARVDRSGLAAQGGVRGKDWVARIRPKASHKVKPQAPNLSTWGHVRQQAKKAPFRNARLRKSLPLGTKHLVHRKS